MKTHGLSFLRKVFNDQSGQSVPILMFGMLCFLGVAGLTVDVGHAYVVRTQLQYATNAAGLAASGDIWNSGTLTSASTEANLYGSQLSTDENYNGNLGTVTTTVNMKCLNMLEPAGTTCTAGSTPNAVQVVQVAKINTVFMRLFHINQLAVQSAATASMLGPAQPWNVAIIEDATGSMANTDSNCGGVTQFQCALQGIQTLLSKTNPCATGVSSCTPAEAVLRVALFTFPNIVTSNLPVANACNGTITPSSYQVMTLPVPGTAGYTPLTYTQTIKNSSGTTVTNTWSASYEVTYGASDADTNGFVSDFYAPTNTGTGGLNPSSSIVQAVGYTGTSSMTGCMPVSFSGIDPNGAQNVGAAQKYITSSANGGTQPSSSTKVNAMGVGEGITYYASAIYAAQSALMAEQAAMTALGKTSNNAIILLSDGQANTQWIYFPQGSMNILPGVAANTFIPYGTAGTTVSTAATGTNPLTSLAYPPGYSILNTTPNYTADVANAYTSPTSEYSSTSANTGLYPDFIDECQQAIIAAQYAQNQGTRVYAVAYGSEDTGCGSGSNADDFTDLTVLPTAKFPLTLNVSFGSAGASASGLTPCITMEDIASPSYFYSDYLQSGSGVASNCQSASHSFTSLADIFLSIGGTFTQPELLPNNAS